MIIRFSVENWMSFKDRATLSMVGGREHQHKDRVPMLRNGKVKVLPVAAIFGGNASGKSNFLRALDFAKKLVVDGRLTNKPVLAEPFILDPDSAERPSVFVFELAIGEEAYEYSFSVTQEVVVEEKLVRIGSAAEKELFSRKGGKFAISSKDERLRFAAEGTRDNQLFLNNSVSQKLDAFRCIYDWFDESLLFISPRHSFKQFAKFLDEGEPQNALFNQLLSTLDTGIDWFGGEDIALENVPGEMGAAIFADLEEGASSRLTWTINDGWITVTRKDGKIQAKKMIAYHTRADGSRAKMEMRQESDGTQRAIDLIPAFLWMLANESTKVIVIDELDRSLHTLLTRKLLEHYFSACTKSTRAQLLFTTHDVMLMDQQLLRRDEMWVTERGADGVSTLTSLWEYEGLRVDANIRKQYLHGQLGGVPRVLIGSMMGGLIRKDDVDV
jgi:AAA15 family ATPase/GTPase